MKEKKLIHKKHPVHVAGRVWIFKEVTYVRDFEGEIGISMAELARIHRAVANAICSEDAPLSREEFEFLCELTQTSNRDVAALLKCSAPTITKWKKLKSLPRLESVVLKEIFWMKIFGDEPLLRNKPLPLTHFGSERLKALGQTALESGLAGSVSKSAA